MDDVDVIIIESSPELYPRHSFSPAARAKPKSQTKPPRRKARISDIVIEITDSESDSELPHKPTLTPVLKRKRRPSLSNEAGPSSLHTKVRHNTSLVGPSTSTTTLQPKAGGTSSSYDNIPTPAASIRGKGKAPLYGNPAPLFLPSDEENEPPIKDNNTGYDNGPELAMEMEPQTSAPAALSVPGTMDGTIIDNGDSGPSGPVPDIDPISSYLAQILEIVPDVQPEHALSLIEKHLPEYKDQVVQPVLHILFEDPLYPKVDRKGKGKQKSNAGAGGGSEDAGGSPKKVKIDYASKERPFEGGAAYEDLALIQLQTDFPYIPKPHLRQVLKMFNRHYAPTHLALAAREKEPKLYPELPSYMPKSTLYNPKGKGPALLHDPVFEAEKAWVQAQHDVQLAEEINGVENGDGIECGCCFSSYPFDNMIQCPEAHLFCTECVTHYAETQLGSHCINLVCMQQTDCGLPFPPSELQRILPEKLWNLYERIKQRKEVEAAGLEGLEECPFCDWKCVIENDQEKLFRCGNEEGGCGAVSCRGCKKPDHLPKSCKEMEEDKVLDAQHAVEEAMSAALMRNCPKCKKAFVKIDGCNKMTCPDCRTISCYVCRAVVKGYDHFAQNLPHMPVASSNNKCPLWEPVEQRHAVEVKEAAEKAMEQLQRDHPDVEEKDLKVDVPAAPAAPPRQAHPYGYHHMHMHPVHMHPMGAVPMPPMVPPMDNLHQHQLMHNQHLARQNNQEIMRQMELGRHEREIMERRQQILQQEQLQERLRQRDQDNAPMLAMLRGRVPQAIPANANLLDGRRARRVAAAQAPRPKRAAVRRR